MLRSSKTAIVSAALVIGVLGGCTQMSDAYYNLMGISRTTPEDADVNFNNRHAPALNNVIPGGGASDNSGARDIYSPQNVERAGRRVPVENNAPSDNISPSGNNAVGGVKTPAVAAVPVAPVTVATVPVSVSPPAAAAAIPPAAAASDTPYPSLAGVPPIPPSTPKAQSTAELNGLVTDRDLSESGRKQLMSDPNATVMTSPQTGQLVDNAANVVAPEVVAPPPVLAQSAPAAQPAPAPAPQAAREDKGFNNWLHHLFPSDDNQAAAAPVKTAARETPSENPVPVSAPAQSPHDLMTGPAVPATSAPPAAVASLPPTPEPLPVAATPAVAADVPVPPPAEMEPVHLHPPAAVADVSPQPAALPWSVPATPAIVADAPVPPPAEMEPVHLHPPAAVAEVSAAPAPPSLSVPPPPAVTADASVVQPAAPQMEPVHLHPPVSSMTADSQPSPEGAAQVANEEPITLVPPPASSQTRYLADSRYAARRMHVPADDDNNND